MLIFLVFKSFILLIIINTQQVNTNSVINIVINVILTKKITDAILCKKKLYSTKLLKKFRLISVIKNIFIISFFCKIHGKKIQDKYLL